METIYEKNPFIDGLEISTGNKSVVIGRMDANGVHNPHGELGIMSEKRVDHDSFVKAYAECFKTLFQLKSSGVKVLCVLLEEMRSRAVNKDIVRLDELTRQTWLDKNPDDKLSVSTFWRGRQDLEEASVIARAPRAGEYFINPAMIFNGNRFKVVNVWERV